jgi:hypothetical protein
MISPLVIIDIQWKPVTGIAHTGDVPYMSRICPVDNG